MSFASICSWRHCTHGTTDCMGSQVPKEDSVPVTGAFFTLWQNYDP